MGHSSTHGTTTITGLWQKRVTPSGEEAADNDKDEVRRRRGGGQKELCGEASCDMPGPTLTVQ